MPKSFNWQAIQAGALERGPRFWLQIAGGVLALLNGIALYLYFAPPGGSKEDLVQESRQVENQIAATRVQTVRLKSVAANVEEGSRESTQFELKYFLPKRLAYATVVAAVQGMASTSGLQERDAVYSEEPIEGTPDLSLLNMTANYEGSYDSLLRFLNEVDRSPMLLMLDALQAAPQQKGGQITASIRFQAIVQDEGGIFGGQP